MALQPGFFTGPPPPAVKATITRSGDVFYGINPDMNRWIQNLWNWTVKFGNNADGAASFSGSIAIGTSPNWFKADASGIWLGGATFGASPFRVSMAGALTATSGTFSGDITSGGTFNTTGYVIASGGATSPASYNASIQGVPTATNAIGGYFKGKGLGEGIFCEMDAGAGGIAGVFSSAAGTGFAVSITGNNSATALAISAGVGQNAIGTSGTISCGAINGTTIPASATLITSGGALGTPSSGTLTECTGLPVSGIAASAWSTTSPTPTAQSGAFTTVSSTFRYQQIGKSVAFSVAVTVTAQGTAGGYIKVALPVTAKNTIPQAFGGGEGIVYLCGAWGFMDASYLYIFSYNGGTLTATGCVIGISGVYEAA